MADSSARADSNCGPGTIPEGGNILIYKHAICMYLPLSSLAPYPGIDGDSLA